MAPYLFIAIAWMLSAVAPVTLPPGSQKLAILRVYVKTDDGGERSELAARRESVKDVTDSMAAKKKTFAVVDTEADADVLIEVLDRALYVPKVVMGLSPRPGDPSSIPGMTTPVRSPVLRVRVTRGTIATVFTNKDKAPESLQGWKAAADDLAGQIEKWVRKSS